MHAAVLLALALAADPTPEAKLVVPKPGQPAVVDVVGIDAGTLTALRGARLTAADWSKHTRFVVDGGKPGEAAARPSVAGTWSVTETAIRFEPLFPLVPGLTYQITCRLHDVPQLKMKATGFTVSLAVPKSPPGPPVAVTAVYPSGDRLPENTLRLYVHFSGPAARGDIYRHLKLVRDDGKEVPSPFLELAEELWSVDGLRVTLLFHPGRVKRELVPREELGPILEEGRKYTLTISRDWTDAEGRPLTADFRKSFTAGPPDDQPIRPENWTLIPPRAGSDAPLILRLAKPLDHALLGSVLSVTDASGKPVAGEVTVGGGERVVTFAPARPWGKGDYRLVIDPRLEDVCGNRVGEPFEVDTTGPRKPAAEPKPFGRPFAVK